MITHELVANSLFEYIGTERMVVIRAPDCSYLVTLLEVKAGSKVPDFKVIAEVYNSDYENGVLVREDFMLSGIEKDYIKAELEGMLV